MRALRKTEGKVSTQQQLTIICTMETHLRQTTSSEGVPRRVVMTVALGMPVERCRQCEGTRHWLGEMVVVCVVVVVVVLVVCQRHRYRLPQTPLLLRRVRE